MPPVVPPKETCFSGVSTRAKLCCFPALLCVWFPDLWHKGHQFPVGLDQRRRLKIPPSHPIVRVLGGGCRLFFFFFFFFVLDAQFSHPQVGGLRIGAGLILPLGDFHVGFGGVRLSLYERLIGLSQLRPSICGWPIAPWLSSIISCSGFYGSVFRCHVSVWRRHYLSNALSCCACWQVFKLKLELWSDQPIIANINFPPLFVVFISGIFREQLHLLFWFHVSNYCNFWNNERWKSCFKYFSVMKLFHLQKPLSKWR